MMAKPTIRSAAVEYPLEGLSYKLAMLGRTVVYCSKHGAALSVIMSAIVLLGLALVRA